MKRTIGYLAIGLISFVLSSCANYYTVKVNGYTEPGTTGGITPGGTIFVMEDKEAKNPLLEAEIRDKITKLLQTKGYPVTTNFDKADYYLFSRYGMGEPRSFGVPEYYGSVGWGYGWGGGWGRGWGWGGPSVGIGFPYSWGTEVVTIYDRWLQINVVEGAPYRANKTTRSVWVGESRSSGASSDMRDVLNYLLVATFKEFGKNTGKALTVKMKENDPEVFSLTH